MLEPCAGEEGDVACGTGRAHGDPLVSERIALDSEWEELP